MASQLLRTLTLASRPHLGAASGRVTTMRARCRLLGSIAPASAREGLETSLNKPHAKDTVISKTASNQFSTDHALRNITFVDPNGEKLQVRAEDGQTVLDIAKSRQLEIEGACQGECACSTCHVVVGSETEYDLMPPTTEKEEDMLDLAYEVTNTSRLACQVRMTPELDKVTIKLPGVVRDARPQ